jgi:hypothetical protein
VAVLPGRHPVLVAKQLASLAALAPRRVLPVFGLRSAIAAEREVFVVPDGERAAVFDESLRVLRAALVEDSVGHRGKYSTVSAAAVAPRPAPPGSRSRRADRSRLGPTAPPTRCVPRCRADEIRHTTGGSRINRRLHRSVRG